MDSPQKKHAASSKASSNETDSRQCTARSEPQAQKGQTNKQTSKQRDSQELGISGHPLVNFRNNVIRKFPTISDGFAAVRSASFGELWERGEKGESATLPGNA